MKINETPATTATAPNTFAAVAFSRKKAKPANAENNGVVEEIGITCDSTVFKKLMFMNNHPTPLATSPPTSNRTSVLRFIFRKPRSLSSNGEKTSRKTDRGASLSARIAKLASRLLVPESVTATPMRVTLTDQTTAVAKLATTPLNEPLASAPLTSHFSRLRSQIPSRITKAPTTAGKTTDSPNTTAHKRLKSGYVAANGTAFETPTDFNPYM